MSGHLTSIHSLGNLSICIYIKNLDQIHCVYVCTVHTVHRFIKIINVHMKHEIPTSSFSFSFPFPFIAHQLLYRFLNPRHFLGGVERERPRNNHLAVQHTLINYCT